MQYARDNNRVLEYPTDEEFKGVPNWRQHDRMLRLRHYLPLHGEAEPQDGYTARPSSWHTVGDGDAAYIKVDAWQYIPIPIPEPILPRQFSKGDLLEALHGCGLYEDAKAIYAQDLDLQIAWAGFADIDMDYQAAKDIMAKYPALFTAENVLRLQQYISQYTNI